MADDFEDVLERRVENDGPGFVVDIDGFEGPIDVLLTLAREQKVDLIHVSILQLADQYLAFVAEARRYNLELAADYLVMAAWLAYLKSRLLLPDLSAGDEPTGEELAAALQFQLQRLEAMQDAGAKLMDRPRLGRDFHHRGEGDEHEAQPRSVWQVSLYDLLKAYADHRKKLDGHRPLQIEPFNLYAVEDALLRLRRLVGHVPDWVDLWRFLPEDLQKGLPFRSAVASTFAASLEMVREGEISLRQDGAYGPISIRPGERSGQ